MTYMKRCEFIAGSISVAPISTAGLNVGGVKPSIMRRDRSERAASTTAIDRFVASVAAPGAAAEIAKVKLKATSTQITGAGRMLPRVLVIKRWILNQERHYAAS